MDPQETLKALSCDERAVAVLSVSSTEDTHRRLRGIFERTNWAIHEARSIAEACAFLQSNPLAVVVCECTLPDGHWQELLGRIKGLATPPRLIVTSPDADDELWRTVLEVGGYDVLARPFEAGEVTRIVSLAWLDWKHSAAAGKGAATAA